MRYETLTTVDSDLSLVHAIKAGDASVFEELVKRYDRQLFRIAQNITHNREDAQDAVQETFLKAFQSLTRFQERSKFSTWLIRIAVNESLMKIRRQHAKRTVSIDDDVQSEEGRLPLEIADWTANPEDRYRASELREILTKTLQTLKPSLRVVFALRDIEGLSVQETAEALELSGSAVKARLWRARLQLRERLNRYFKRATEFTGRELDGRRHVVKTACRGEETYV